MPSLDYKFQPLDGNFPRDLTPINQREHSRFGKTWAEVQNILEKELRMLRFRSGSVVLLTAHSPDDVRKDGKLRSDARNPEHPGIVLNFEIFNPQTKSYEPMSFNCDKFTEWKANVRAVADALEALRKVDRYGVFGGVNQSAHYEGFKALPSGESGLTDDKVADVVLASFLAVHSTFQVPEILTDKTVYTRAYKQAAAKLHPDNKITGDNKAFLHLQKIRSILEQKFN